MLGLEPKAKELGRCPGGSGTPEKNGVRVLFGPRKGPSGLREEVGRLRRGDSSDGRGCGLSPGDRVRRREGGTEGSWAVGAEGEGGSKNAALVTCPLFPKFRSLVGWGP